MAEPLKVVICGAGPAGLVLAHYLLSLGKGKFKVVIYDKAEDPRETIKQEKSYRRYTIGLSKRTYNCLSLVPGLIEQVKDAVIEPDKLSMLLPAFSSPLLVDAPPGSKGSGWVVDRVSLCSSLLTALMNAHGQSHLLQIKFKCPCTEISLEGQTATFTPLGEQDGAPITEKYDLLVGADGLRSVVRLAFQQQMRTFEVEQKNLPGCWAVTHFDCPKGSSVGTFYMMPVIPRSGGLSSLGLPSPDGSLCLILGWNRNDDPSSWLACSTPAQAQQYIQSRLPHLQIPEDAAWKLRSVPLQSSAQVKCWQYHDTWGHAVLIGDAAHATSPNIGQGCNASIVDASVLARLLLGELVGEASRAPEPAQHGAGVTTWAQDPTPAQVRERLPALLSHFSALQVKEGQALVDLSDANGPITSFAKVLHSVSFLVRLFLSNMLPFLVSPPVMVLAGQTTLPYSKIYGMMRWEVDFFHNWNNKMRALWVQEDASAALKKEI